MTARLSAPKRISIALSCAFTVTLSLWGSPILAGDPFRSSNPRDIGENTEAAFEAIFQEGNYPQAKRYLSVAEANETDEPLAYAMRASLAYMDKDWETLKAYARKTLQAAQQLQSQDPLRGNLYTAVGHFLEGAHTYKTEGAVGAVPKLQKVFQYLDEAEKKAPNDPELNLLKGYLELLLAVNLPFSSPEQAIEQFEDLAAPDYLVDRGIAIAYRDLEEYNKALQYVNQAIQATSNNPELYYLKGQILVEQGEQKNNSSLVKQAVENFDKALEKAEQLPKSLTKQIRRERQKAQEYIDS